MSQQCNQTKIQIEHDIDIKQHVWMKIGGRCTNFISPKSPTELSEYLSAKKDDKFIVLGAGSNVLIDDRCIFDNIISTSKLREIKIVEDKIEAQAGVFLTSLSSFAKRHAIQGYEFMVGIPGSVGGAVCMNAGAWGSQTSDHLHSIKLWQADLGVTEIKKADLDLRYRRSSIKEGQVVLSAKFDIKRKNTIAEIDKLIKAIKQKRSASQPIIRGTGGSTFKNPKDGMKAWQLIKEAGAQDIVVGDMSLSHKHANFMINSGSASFMDAINLGERIIETVYNKFNIQLEWEIVRFFCLGEKN